jgi:NADPH2:quinone reductase
MRIARIMRAIVCREYGPPEKLVIEHRPSPVAHAAEVVVAVRAAGVNFTDVLATQGRSQLRVKPPFTPGVEVSGVITSTGPGVTRVREGMRVLATCYHGGYAEELTFAEHEVMQIPDSMDFETAAAFYIASNTALYALQKRARLRPGESLLVIGAGSGAGIAAVEIGKALGARVVAAASSDEKLALARKYGADETSRYPPGPLDLDAQKALTAKLRALTAGQGFAVIYDGVGGTYAEPALRSMARGARFLAVGFAAGVPSIPLSVALFHNADIMGIELSSPEDREPGRNPDGVATLLRLFEQGKLRPEITARFPLEEAGRAQRLLLDRRATGRIVLVTSR